MDGTNHRELAACAEVLDAVDAALERLDAGTYGSCLECGESIPDVDLVVDPTRPACARHEAA